MDNLSLPSFSKKSVIPCFVRKRDVTQSFASLSNFIPRFVGTRNKKVSSPASSENEMSLNPSRHYQISFPALSEYGIPNVIPRFVGTRNIKFHSPVGRITEVYSNSVFSSVIPSVYGPEMSPIKCLFLQTISLQIHFKISPCLFKILSSFHLSSYNYQHGSEQSFSPIKL